ncbi:MAG: right-handed parallel beta-helix repeat-containing protein [Planctomycetes bacterium]|nr:right-handed parallel beta-helix repeat-containing protein [Planctomycetota bacterium]
MDASSGFRRRFALVVGLLALGAPLAVATELRVPKDFATIQAALDAAISGNSIRIAAGTYDEVLTVTGKSDVTMFGVGTVVIDGGTAVGATLTIESCDGFTLKNVRVRRGDIGVHTKLSSGIALLGVRATKCVQTGLFVASGERARIESCIVEGGLHEAIRSAVEYTTISKCVVPKSGGGGIVLLGGLSYCGSNTVSKTGADGITASGGRIVLEKNVVKNAGGRGVFVASASEVVVRANKIQGAATTGLACDANGVVVDGNSVVGSGARGIDVEGASIKLVANTIRSSGSEGLFVGSASTDVVVLANKVRQSQAVGFVIGGDQVVLAENVSKNNQGGLTLSATDVDQFANQFQS